MLLMEEIAHSFMETSNKKSFNEIIFDFSKIELEFEDKKMKLPSKVIERLVSHWKNIVYIYMSSPECQNYNYYEKPIAEIQKVLLIHELRDSTINKYLSILTKIGKDAYLKYNLPEVTVFIKNTLFEIGAFYESNGILDSQLCPAHNIVDLYLSCPGLEQKEEELNKKIYHTYEDPKRKEEKANALLKSIYYDFKAANIHAEDLYPGE